MSTRSYASSRRAHRGRPPAKKPQPAPQHEELDLELSSLAADVAELQEALTKVVTRLASLRRPEPEKPAPEAAHPKVIELPREFAETGLSYWLRRCEGFEVTTDGESIGWVDGVCFERRHDRPDRLIVATDGFRSRRLDIPVELVAAILHDEELVILTGDPRSPG